MKIEYKITFELENNEDWKYGSNKEFVLADCLCSLIDQGKSYKNGEEFKDEDRDFCLAKVKKRNKPKKWTKMIQSAKARKKLKEKS